MNRMLQFFLGTVLVICLTLFYGGLWIYAAENSGLAAKLILGALCLGAWAGSSALFVGLLFGREPIVEEVQE